MDAKSTLERLRMFLLLLAISMCVGTVVELLLAKHTEDTIQLIPFFLCGLGFVALLAMLLRPQRMTLWFLRGSMALIMAGSLFGIYEHLENNIAFQLELQPSASLSDVWLKALQGGNPLLAPGILALAGIIALLATYYHPALEKTP